MKGELTFVVFISAASLLFAFGTFILMLLRPKGAASKEKQCDMHRARRPLDIASDGKGTACMLSRAPARAWKWAPARASALAPAQATPLPTFHILIATAGRPSLRRMLQSLVGELKSGDALTVVFDGHGAKEQAGIENEYFMKFDKGVAVEIMTETPNLGFWGHGIRTKYQGRLKPATTFIMHADDDDVYVEGAFAKLRLQCTDAETLYIARMKTSEGGVLPSTLHTIKRGDVGTPCGIIPTRIADKSVWKYEIGGDGTYYEMVSTFSKNGFKILDEIIYIVRPKTPPSAAPRGK